ncbi:hypothetical protein NKH77_08450 [Streptomyces sp. M19]
MKPSRSFASGCGWPPVGRRRLCCCSRAAADGGPSRPVVRNLHLLDALDQFLAYAGFALFLFALLALLPSGGGLVLATGGVTAGTISVEAAIQSAALGGLGIVLMNAASGDDGTPRRTRRGSQGANARESSGRARVGRGQEYEDYLEEKLGKRSFQRGKTRIRWIVCTGRRSRGVARGQVRGILESRKPRPQGAGKIQGEPWEARQIAERNGKEFTLISENPIPENIVKWLTKKNFTWRVIPKEAG